jgi:O-acetyl-ADP-ribose deacetylase (regulator of RNase III)
MHTAIAVVAAAANDILHEGGVAGAHHTANTQITQQATLGRAASGCNG